MWMLLWAACGQAPPSASPPVTIAYGSQAQGEIEPCGCPKRPLGGLARRNSVIAAQRQQGPVLVVDAGDSLGPSSLASPGGDPQQRRLKAELVASAWEAGGMDAIALGAEDWKLGTDFVRGLVEGHHLPLLAANLTCGDAQPYPGGKVLEVDGHRIGVVGVTEGSVDGCVVTPAVPALESAIAALGPVDLVIGLLPYSTDRDLAGAMPEPVPLDLAIDARGRSADAGPEYRSGAFYVGAGAAMHAVSLLDLRFVDGARAWMADGQSERLQKTIDSDRARVEGLDERLSKMSADDPQRQTYQRQRDAYQRQLEDLQRQVVATGEVRSRFSQRSVDLDDHVPDDPQVAAMVAATKKQITALAGDAGAGSFVPRVVEDASSPYAGGEACVSCHKAEHAQWSTTAHARAWQGLIGKDRAMDEECWSCHVSGANQPGGPDKPAGSGPFHDVQCEACHGPGRAHVADPKGATLVADPPETVCRGCHDGKRDEGRFDFATYRPQIAHGVAK